MAPERAKPRGVKSIFKEYVGRRKAIIKALTEEFDRFKRLSDEDNVKLRLYGHRDESWEVKLPVMRALSTESAIMGISLSRDKLESSEWLPRVAMRSDSWLMSIAFYHGARLSQRRRNKLFKLINELPTVFEVVSPKEPIEDKSNVGSSGSKSQGGNKDEEEHNAQDKQEHNAQDEQEHNAMDKQEHNAQDEQEHNAQDEKGQASD